MLQSLEYDHLVKLPNLKDSYGYTLLRCCSLEKRYDGLQLIAEHLSEKDWYKAISRANAWKWTPFHWSCYRGNSRLVRVMLDNISQDLRYTLLQQQICLVVSHYI